MNQTQRNNHDSVKYEGQPLGAVWPHVILISLVFYSVFHSRVIIAPLLPEIEAQLGLGHAESGVIFLFISFGFSISLLCSGFIASRIHHNRLITLSSLLVGVFLVVSALSSTYWWLLAGLTGLGLSCGVYLPSGIASLTSLVRRQDWGKTLAIHQTAPNLAYVTAPILAELLSALLDWRLAFGLFGVISFGLGIIHFKFGRGGDFKSQSVSWSDLRSFFTNPALWVFIPLFSLAIGSNQGVFNISTLYLVAERGFTRIHSNTLISVSRAFAIFFPLLAGWLADRYGVKKVLIIIVAVSGVATLLFGWGPDWLVPSTLFVQAFFGSCFFTVGFAALSQTTDSEHRSLAVSLSVPAGHLFGGGLTPAMLGFLGDYGYFGTGIALLGILNVVGIFLVLRLRMPAATSQVPR